jgi:hypothetical protein
MAIAAVSRAQYRRRVDVAAELFDPRQQTWQRTGPVAVRRIAHTATVLQDGRVLVTGGQRRYEQRGGVAAAELFDPQTNAWQATMPTQHGRLQHAACLLPDGRALVVGGAERQAVRQLAEIYDPRTARWTTAASLRLPLTPGGSVQGWCAVPLPTAGMLLVHYTDTAASQGHPLVVERYDAAADVWVVERDAPRNAWYWLLPLADGRVLVLTQWPKQPPRIAFFDAKTARWSPAQETSGLPLRLMTCAVLGDDVLATAGSWPPLGNPASRRSFLLDISSGSWREAAPMLRQRLGHRLVTLLDGRVLAVGGQPWMNQPEADDWLAGEVYDPGSDVWTATPD